MEKRIYILWKQPQQSIDNFRRVLLTQASRSLMLAGACKLRISVADNDVSAAHKLRIVSALLAATPGVPDAVASFWIDPSANQSGIESILKEHSNIICGYQVSEQEPIANTMHIAPAGQRTHGMNQVVLLRKPQRLTREQWLDIWLNQHTPIAIATQSTFGYRQNIMIRTLTENALPIDAIVEENFPPEAMTSAHAFYNAVGNDPLMRKHQTEMFTSVQRFVDLDKLDCLPMSEYNL